MRTFFHTFGCRVNQSETESVREKLLAEGHEEAQGYKDADLCVVNTCTVTREADKDALRLVRKIGRDNPAARLVVTGCYATRAPKEIRDAAPDALIVSNGEKDSIPALLGCRTAPLGYSVTQFGARTRAFVKIQDGCNMSCAYCIIPSIRPTMFSKPAAELEAEVKGLIGSGYREIVLCGIRLGRYLDDTGGKRLDFVGLLRRLLSLDGEFRIRLSSYEVTDVTDRFLSLYKEFPGRLCPYLHVPLQSGSDEVLKRMERWYSSGFFRRRIESARSFVPDLALFTDILTAFPGETAAQHVENVKFIEEIGFAGLHVFRFSARSGTPAARMRPLGERTVEARSLELRALDKGLRRKFSARERGQVRTVLAERPDEGLTEHFLRVRLEPQAQAGRFVQARIGAVPVGAEVPLARLD